MKRLNEKEDKRMKKIKLPLFQGFGRLSLSSIPKEIMAGVTLAIVSIPEVMGYTRISGTPIVTGIYTLLLPMIAFSVFGGSKHLVVAADSATAAILAQGISPLATQGTATYMSYVVLLSYFVGVLLLLFRLLQLGFVAKFLSKTVLVGFLTGVGVQVALEQLSGMLGITSLQTNALFQAGNALLHIRQAEVFPVAISMLVLTIIFLPNLFKKKAKWLGQLPWALLALIASMIIGYFIEGAIQTVGALPSGLPKFTFPSFDFSVYSSIFGIALTIVIVIVTQSAATSESYASKNAEEFNENDDLLGLGLANIAAGLTGTFVVNGSPTKTQIASEAGAKSQFANLSAVVVVLAVLLFLTQPLSYLPDAALSALVFTIGIKLIDVKSLKTIFRQQKREFYIAVLVALIVVLWGAAQGIMVAIVLALVWHIHRSYHPNNSLLSPITQEAGRIVWVYRPIKEGSAITSGIYMYHFAASIYYANADIIPEEISKLKNLKTLLFDCSAISDIDYTGGQVLRELFERLKSENVQIGLVQVAPNVLIQLEKYDILTLIGNEHVFLEYMDAVEFVKSLE